MTAAMSESTLGIEPTLLPFTFSTAEVVIAAAAASSDIHAARPPQTKAPSKPTGGKPSMVTEKQNPAPASATYATQ